MTGLEPHVRALLEAPNYAHLATVLPDGSPHSVPLWVGLEGDHIVFLTGPDSRKARNIDHDAESGHLCHRPRATFHDGCTTRSCVRTHRR